jgi:two-component system chemotaxis response regulator CheY
MNQLYIICIDDQPEVLHALEQDLSFFEKHLSVEVCDTGQEALELIEEIDAEGDQLAILISDQVMPGLTGVDVLKEIQSDGRFKHAQKILLTGLATHQDTINAINTGGLDHYVEKPWNKEAFSQLIKKALTHFILERGIEYQPYMDIIDQPTLYENLRNIT